MSNIIVIGGSNIDIFALSDNAIKAYDSNPGSVLEAYGGVGRNIAENLGRLELKPTLITAMAKDDVSRFNQHLSDAGVNLEVILSEKTSQYVAVLDNHCDMYVAVSAMQSYEKLKYEDFMSYLPLIQKAKFLVIDTNLDGDVIEEIIKETSAAIYVDAISSLKLLKIRRLLTSIDVIKLNEIEARSLFDSELSLEQLLQKLQRLGPKRIYLTMGAKGAYAITRETIQYRTVIKAEKTFTTGAGDAFLSGVIYADINGLDSLLYGQLNARFCLDALSAVNPNLTPMNLEKLRREQT